MSLAIKQQLYDLAHTKVDEKVAALQATIADAQDAANSETKSTAGDKHDTARAMMQLEVEQKSKQLSEALKMKQAFAQFNPTSGQNSVALGSLIITSAANYYISVSIGKLSLNGTNYFGISPISPIAQACLGKKKGDTFIFNGKSIQIKEVL